jgi:hypothetical protein
MDSLLREGARRGLAAPAAPFEQSAPRHGDGGVLATPSGAHLDADEQNAYAENSLPASARTHYAAHLADCDDCRRSVTQLALAAGIPAQLERQAATGHEVLPDVASNLASNVSWRERIGALFAPRAWRYAVPALALLLVGAAALMVSLRVQRNEVSVAQRSNTSEQSKPERPASESTETHHAPQNGNNAAPASAEGVVQPAPDAKAPNMKEEVAAAAGESQEQPKTGAILSEDAPPPPPVAPLSTGAGTASAPAAATASDMPPAPTPAPEARSVAPEVESKGKVTERTDELARESQRRSEYETNQQRDRASGPRRNSNNEQSRNMQTARNADISRDGADKEEVAIAKSAPASRPAARRAKPRGADGERDAGSSDDSARNEGARAPKPDVETRTVAGRKFRRAGSAWIDTAYKSSQAVTSVRRNSEQYRALVADEPELRRISDALGGEVTVVWKGRAYRIR